jgi:hypothetical protein
MKCCAKCKRFYPKTLHYCRMDGNLLYATGFLEAETVRLPDISKAGRAQIILSRFVNLDTFGRYPNSITTGSFLLLLLLQIAILTGVRTGS